MEFDGIDPQQAVCIRGLCVGALSAREMLWPIASNFCMPIAWKAPVSLSHWLRMSLLHNKIAPPKLNLEQCSLALDLTGLWPCQKQWQ